MSLFSERQIENFWRHVVKGEPDSCWLWTGATNRHGYGNFSTKPEKRFYRSNRVAWMLAFGEILPGLRVCHRCDVRLCVNPAHLFLGTAKDNTRDMVEKGRAASGERNGMAKLTRAAVAEIRALWSQGLLTQRQLGLNYGVSQTAISAIVRGKKWRELSGIVPAEQVGVA